VQSRALAHALRTAAGAGGLRRLFPARAPPDQFRVPLAACLPLSPESASHSPPDPRIQTSQHRGRFAEAEV